MQRENKDKKGSGSVHRVNYEGHSLKFLDWVDSMGFERTLLGRWLQLLDDKFLVRRAGWVFLYCVLLSYLIFYKIDFQDNYEIGQVLKVNIVSPVAFQMIDEVSTEELRQKAELEVGDVYDYHPETESLVTSGLIQAFKEMRSQLDGTRLDSKKSLRKIQLAELFKYKIEFEKILGKPVSDYQFEWLIESQFDAKIEDIILRNLSVWYKEKIVKSLAANNQKNTNENNGQAKNDFLTFRLITDGAFGAEENISKSSVIEIHNLNSFKLTETKGMQNYSESFRVHIKDFARSLIKENFILNEDETKIRREKYRASVAPVVIEFNKNQIIVEAGQPIELFDMAVIKEVESLQDNPRKDVMAVSLALVLAACVLVFFSYLRRFTLNKVKIDLKDMYVMMFITFSIVLFLKFWIIIMEVIVTSKIGYLIPGSIILFAAPIAAGPMMVGLLVTAGEVVWLFTAFLSLCIGIMTDFNFSLMLVTMVGGLAAARGIFVCKKRNDIYWAGVRTGFVNAFLVTFILVVVNIDHENLFKEILIAAPAGFVGGILSSLVAMMFIPLLESLFNYTTDIKLLELSNLNHPLLKEMIVKAPGTYHHSMMVGSMVEAAAEEISANPLLGKVMCYYHDIGKMVYPKYFIENQRSGQNPHDHISPYMSKTLLIAHVKDGVEMGMKHKLGKPIIDGILQHHGTTLISFFYNKSLEAQNEDESDSPEEEFRYPGPKPQFREAALCMLADSIEAASRSLDEPTPVRLQNIVRNVIQRKFSDGQLDECNLTLKDLSNVETAFVRILIGIYHQRIDYPRSAGGGLGEITKNEMKK